MVHVLGIYVVNEVVVVPTLKVVLFVVVVVILSVVVGFAVVVTILGLVVVVVVVGLVEAEVVIVVVVIFFVVVIGLAVVVSTAVVVLVVSSEAVVVSAVVVFSVVVVEEMDTSFGKDSSGTGGVCPQAVSRVIQRSTQKSCIPIRFINILLYNGFHLYTRKKTVVGYRKCKNFFCKFYVPKHQHQSTYNIAFFSP